jgi:hypothetical protein
VKLPYVFRTAGSTVCCAIAVLTTMQAVAQVPSGPVSITGTLRPGQPGQVPYEVVQPANWNGTLVVDLDFTTWRPYLRKWYLDHGVAVGGVRRLTDSGGYDLQAAAENLVEVRRLFSEKIGSTPRRTIVTGGSRGAYVALGTVDRFPDVFDGALVQNGGSLGLVAKMLSALDMVWALKTLEDPNGPVNVVHLSAPPPRTTPPAAYVEEETLQALVKKTQTTPVGRAHLALAAAFMQPPRWSIRNSPKPLPGDREAELNNLVESAVTGGPMYTQTIRWTVEAAAGGNPSWNTGVDYADLLNRSGLRDLVELAYKKAGADLSADLAALARAPRISADPAAVTTAERALTYQGKTKTPVLTATTMDAAEPPSIETAFAKTLRSVGKEDLVRSAYVGRTGHMTYTLLETATLFQTLMNRLDTGKWGDSTTAARLNALAAEIKSRESGDGVMGESAFIDYEPAPALRTWDFSNWGTYRAPAPIAQKP